MQSSVRYFATLIEFMTWGDHIISYYKTFKPQQLPNNIEWLYPQQSEVVMEILKTFCRKFYNDQMERTLFLGINPGRFGAGITGINFTAPKQLSGYCGIQHPFREGSEISAEFIYDVIETYGGVKKFYSQFFIGSVCPMGFIKDGKNINYYDDKELLTAVEPFIIKSIEHLVSYKTNRKLCICIGGEKNYKYLSALNEKHHWFETITSVPHPRFVMQYRRKFKEQFIQQYLQLM